MSDAYELDFDAWTQQTAQLMKAGRWAEVDVLHLAEEIADLGKRDRRAVVSQLIRLLMHLLKWEYQPNRRSDSWLDSISDARIQIELALEDSPSLNNYLQSQLDKSYERARRQAAQQTGIAIAIFPEQCQYALADVLSESWLPTH